MCRIWEDDVVKSFTSLGDIDQVPYVLDAIRINLVQLVLAYPIWFERMCNVSSIEVVGIDVEISTDE